MTRVFLLGALAAWLSILSAASFRVQELVQVPAMPQQRVYRMKTDSQGNVVVSASLSLPPNSSNSYGLIKKLDTSGKEQFSLLLPGADQMPIAIDSHDDIYVAGCTYAQEQFPFTNRPGFLFVMKLRGMDGTIVFSTSLPYDSCPTAIAVDSGGQVILAGNGRTQTTSGAYTSPPGNYVWLQTMIMRYSPATDQIVFAARYGGTTINCLGASCGNTLRATTPTQVLLDGQGNIWVAGSTNTSDLPITPDALQTACGCGLYLYDGFFSEFSADGTRLLYATYLGTSAASSIAPDGDDRITTAAFDAAGRLWMAGTTKGDDFPVTSNAIQKQRSDADGSLLSDGFLAGYDPAANRLVYASYFGGQGNDSTSNLQILADGTILFAGHSESAALPVAAAGFTRGTDFVASLDVASGAVSGLTRFANGTTGAGLALTPAGLVVSGAENVVSYLQMGNDNGPTVYAVANGGGAGVTGQVSPGEVISLYGVHIGPSSPVVADLSSGRAPTILGGVQVLFDGVPAPVFYAQDDQINAIVPFGVLLAPIGSGTTRLVISTNTVSSNAALLGVVEASPEAFKVGGTLRAAALNQDGTVNSATNRANPGSIVSVFATGFGAMQPAPADGQVLTGTLPALTESVQVGSLSRAQPFEITYAGPAPNFAAGVVQVSFRLPSDLYVMEPELLFTIGGWPSGTFTLLVNGVSPASTELQ